MTTCTHRIEWLYPLTVPGMWRCVACEQTIRIDDANWTEYEATHS